MKRHLIATSLALGTLFSVNALADDFVLQGFDVGQSTQTHAPIKIENIPEAKKYSDTLFRNSKDPVVGNPNGRVTLVEFMDFSCGYCKKSQAAVTAIVDSNPDLRVVFKEYPIKGEASVLAAKIALAANKQGKYWEMHEAMMKLPKEELTQSKLFAIAKSHGLDMNKLKRDIKNPDFVLMMRENLALGRELQIPGTPAFFIAASNFTAKSDNSNIKFMMGQMSQKGLQANINSIPQ